jgi:putative toxin-antitoxin system antitoxin component (TIGR02293 family)
MSKPLILLEPSVSYSTFSDKDMLSLIDLIRKGVKYTLFIALTRNSPFKLSEWSDFLHISERTMQRYEAENKVFDPGHSEKIIRITMFYNYGIEVFGNKDKFNSWLETPNLALGKLKPKALLDNAFGLELLKDELTRIEHGVLS